MTQQTAAYVYAQLPANWKLTIVHANFGSAFQNFLKRNFGLNLDPIKKLEQIRKTVKKDGPVVLRFPMERAFVLTDSEVKRQEVSSAITYLNFHAKSHFQDFLNVDLKRENEIIKIIFS